MTKYTTVQLPEGIVKEIDEIINDSSYGYSSRAEFVKEAVRDLLYKRKSQKDNVG